MINQGNMFAVETCTERGEAFTLKDAKQAIAAVVGEWLEISGASQIALLSDDPSVVASLDGSRVTFAKPGRYEIKAAAGFQSVVIAVVACDPDLLRFVHVEDMRGVSGVASADVRRRRLFREMARWEPGFDGTKDTFFNFNPKNFGAVDPPPVGVVPA